MFLSQWIHLIRIGAGGFDDPFLWTVINLDELFYFIDRFIFFFRLRSYHFIDASTTETIYRLSSRFDAEYSANAILRPFSS